MSEQNWEKCNCCQKGKITGHEERLRRKKRK